MCICTHYMVITRKVASLSVINNDTQTTEINTLSLHDALPISRSARRAAPRHPPPGDCHPRGPARVDGSRRCLFADGDPRSEEHTSELQSHVNLVCRLLLEKKKSWIVI